MANFVKRQTARESVESENQIDGLSNVESEQDNLETQLSELSSQDSELEQLDQDQEVLSTDIQRTNDHVDQAVEARENGEELSEQTVASAEVAQESIRKRWELNVARVARESYRRGRGRTAAAESSWKETLKGLWERFLQLLKEIKNKIKDFKLKYINVGKTAVKRGKKYKEILRGLGKKEKDEIGGGFVSKLAIEGKYDVEQSIAIGKDVTTGKVKGAVAALTKQASESSVVVNKAADGEFKASKAVGESVGPYTGGGNRQGNTYEGEFTKFDDVPLFGTAASKLSNLPEFEDGEGSKLYALPGNAYIQFGSKKLAGGIDFTAVAFMATGDKVDDATIPTPDVSKMSAAAAALEAIGGGFEKILQDFRSYDNELDKLERAAEKAARALDKADDANRDALTAARSAADQAVKNYQTFNRAVNHTANSVLAGLNEMIGAGIAAYSKSKK
ncbi:MAG: hypothetical protein ACRDBQ_18650 [Shewanella sp.]